MFLFLGYNYLCHKAKYKINKIYVIKARYTLLVIANLLIYHYFYMLNYTVLQHVFVFLGYSY